MTWTAPRTWTTGELVTASILNTHVRDNLLDGFGTDGETKTGKLKIASGVRSARVASLTVLNSTATTVIDLTTLFTGTYVTGAGAMAFVSGAADDGSDIGGCGVIFANANGSGAFRFSVQTLTAGGTTGVTYAISGNNLRVTQASGGTRTMQFTLLLVPMVA